ncbi:LTA synthase family protein [Paenibacillus hamazuiensis]|uniref:LTA synthase family protein n=1 Tax=Paenibacillus hamazuiensis TaxID=2936508 RepID=UPI00200BAED5|nr:LTA synthase family protein [Paenibacillus hamazuiensis]
MLKFAIAFFKTLSARKLWLARLCGFGLLSIICLAVTTSGYESGKRVIVLGPVPELTGEQLKRKPNIVVVLSEAFWDPTLIQSVKFSRDPIPFFHALAEKHTSGWLLSPQFGGVTANVEFEVLTGNSIRFLSTDTVAYEEHVHANIDSLASILSGQGYRATAVSAFYDWFANTRQTFERFGFSRFISNEFFGANEYEGPYLADRAVARRIIEESRKTDGPDFIYANTMENHYHFYPGKFRRNTIDVTGDIPRADIGILETYAQGISDADRMLETLVDYFTRSQEPTVIVFFGDHLPHFEEDYRVYRDTGYISGDSDPQFLEKMHKTPVIVWNNFSRQPKESLDISPSFLGPYVLNLAGVQGTPYTEFLYNLSKRMPIFPPKEYFDKYRINQADVAEYEAWQSKMLAGELTDQSARTLVMGYDSLAITEFAPAEISAGEPFKTDFGRQTVSIRGGPFGQATVLTAGGKPLETTWVSESTVTATLPKEMYEKPGSLELKAQVIDEKGTVLAESKPVEIKVVNK